MVAKNSGTLEVRLYNDYYPFGTTGTNDYRYGYQGQYAEKDPETNWNAFELRMYDSRIARWLTIDPADEYWSPYAAMGNNPLSITDPTGGEGCDDCPDSKTLSEIIIRSTPRKTFNWLGLPKGMSKEVYNNNVNYSALIRDRHANGEPLLQDNDPDSYRNDFARYERSYQANQEWRQMNYNLLEFASVWVPMPKLAVLKWLRYEGTTAKTSSRAFFSGAGTEVRAISEGFETLGQTRAGRNLQNLIDSRNIPWSEAEPMWQRLSATWAKGIPNGSTVNVFLNNPRAGAIWFKTELPILQQKGINLIYR